MSKHDVVVVGDGPMGLSAALLLAKNGLATVVFGQDETAMHKALLRNYLGIKEEGGTSFMERARDQVRSVGADLRRARVTSIEHTADGFTVTTEDGEEAQGRYLVLATGTHRELGKGIGLAYDGDVIVADRNGRTNVERAYTGGWAARAQKIQAAISLGDGAAVALDILSAEKGKPFHDFDVPE